MKIEDKIEFVVSANEDALLADGFEDALIGICYRANQPPIACYDYDRCIAVLMESGMTDEEAIEYFDFNVLGAWVGEETPAFIRLVREERYLL